MGTMAGERIYMPDLYTSLLSKYFKGRVNAFKYINLSRFVVRREMNNEAYMLVYLTVSTQKHFVHSSYDKHYDYIHITLLILC